MNLQTRVQRFTGLKATGLTEILDVSPVPGYLLGIYVIDPDDLTQNERIQITIDGYVVINDAAFDIPNTDLWLYLLRSIAKGSFVHTAVAKELPDHGFGIPFRYQLKVEYLRAAAGTTGLTINVVYAVQNPAIEPNV